MHFTTITFSSLFAATVLATASPKPYKLGTMSFNKAFGLSKRQGQGYQPTQNFCGSGDTCAEACGTGYITCDSTVDEGSHCFNPNIGETCCPNLSGNSCSAGYYCTEDTQSNTWCCPNGMDLVACAAAYSLTVPLVSQTPLPSTSSATTVPATITSTSSSYSSYSVPSTSPKTTTPVVTPALNGTKTTTSTAVLFTGAANQHAAVYGALPALAMAAGAALVL